MAKNLDYRISFGEILKEGEILKRRILIDNIPCAYSIKSNGMIINERKNKELKKKSDPSKYIQICIYIKNEKPIHLSIHRLVALAFIPNDDTENKIEVNHKDFNRSNNDISNLEWVTKEENMIHSMTNPYRKTKYNKLSESRVRNICELIQQNKLSLIEIGKKFDIDPTIISNIYLGKSYSHISNEYNFTNYTHKTIGKLTEKQVRDVCKYLEENQLSISDIENILNIPKGTIRDIKNGIVYRDISKDYNISNYNQTEYITVYSDSQIHLVCNLMEENKLTPLEIYEQTGVPISYISDIRRGKKRKKISSLYNIKNYTKYFQKTNYSEDFLTKLDELIIKGFSNKYIFNYFNINSNSTTKSLINNHRRKLKVPANTATKEIDS